MACVEALPDEKRGSAGAFLIRAVRWFRERGVQIERVMTDHGSCYISKRFRKAVRGLGARHIRTRPSTPKTNGKAERVFQTLLREWAYAIAYRPSEARNRDLRRWLDWYNQKRLHAAHNDTPPSNALNNLVGKHS